jgi:hypothetical protein
LPERSAYIHVICMDWIILPHGETLDPSVLQMIMNLLYSNSKHPSWELQSLQYVIFELSPFYLPYFCYEPILAQALGAGKAQAVIVLTSSTFRPPTNQPSKTLD